MEKINITMLGTGSAIPTAQKNHPAVLLQYKNENILIDYESDVSDLNILTTLTYPDKTSKQIIFPATIKAEQIGTYELEVVASKQGYKDVLLKEQFGVIENEANISEATFDFKISEFDYFGIEKGKFFIYLFLSVLVLAILIIIFFIIKKKKNLNSSSELQKNY